MNQLVPIHKIVTENARVKSFYFHYTLQAEPGQYVKISIPGHEERPFGAVIIDEHTFLISVGKVGEMTTKLHEMHEGDSVTIQGPFGTYFTLPPDLHKTERLALVAGGYGMAPLAYLARKAAEKDYQVDLFAGARSKDDIFVYPFLKHRNITIHQTTDDGSAGQKGFVTDAFADYLTKNKPIIVYIVGPEIMEQKIMVLCQKYNLPFQISLTQLASEPYGPIIDNNTYQKLIQVKELGHDIRNTITAVQSNVYMLYRHIPLDNKKAADQMEAFNKKIEALIGQISGLLPPPLPS